AATGEHGDLLDVIREARGLSNFSDVVAEAEAFLRLPPTSRDNEAPLRSKQCSSRDPVISARRLFAAAQPRCRSSLPSALALGPTIPARAGSVRSLLA
ncbi:hypothetical protein V5F85_23790, partial [Xanthobacter autotrophicus ATCC 700551]